MFDNILIIWPMTGDMGFYMWLQGQRLLECRLASSASWSYNLGARSQGRPGWTWCKGAFDGSYVQEVRISGGSIQTISGERVLESCVDYSIPDEVKRLSDIGGRSATISEVCLIILVGSLASWYELLRILWLATLYQLVQLVYGCLHLFLAWILGQALLVELYLLHSLGLYIGFHLLLKLLW